MSKWSQHIWCIAYIESEYISRVKEDLAAFPEYAGIEAYIPTVKILKKVFKGKNEFEEVPLLFNYGFFKMPIELACNHEFLAEMRIRIACLYSWVKDPIIVIREKPKLKIGNHLKYYKVPIAIAQEKEISDIIQQQKNQSIYDEADIASRKIGDIITLRGYPFDDMAAKIITINHSKKEVKVELLLNEILKEVTVAFENVFYTIYAGDYADKPGREQSLDEMKERSPSSVERLFVKL